MLQLPPVTVAATVTWSPILICVLIAYVVDGPVLRFTELHADVAVKVDVVGVGVGVVVVPGNLQQTPEQL